MFIGPPRLGHKEGRRYHVHFKNLPRKKMVVPHGLTLLIRRYHTHSTSPGSCNQKNSIILMHGASSNFPLPRQSYSSFKVLFVELLCSPSFLSYLLLRPPSIISSHYSSPLSRICPPRSATHAPPSITRTIKRSPQYKTGSTKVA